MLLTISTQGEEQYVALPQIQHYEITSTWHIHALGYMTDNRTVYYRENIPSILGARIA